MCLRVLEKGLWGKKSLEYSAYSTQPSQMSMHV